MTRYNRDPVDPSPRFPWRQQLAEAYQSTTAGCWCGYSQNLSYFHDHLPNGASLQPHPPHSHLEYCFSPAVLCLSFKAPMTWILAICYIPSGPWGSAQLFSICFSLLFRLGTLYHFTVTSILQLSPSTGLFVWDNVFFSPLLPLGSSLGLLFLC